MKLLFMERKILLFTNLKFLDGDLGDPVGGETELIPEVGVLFAEIVPIGNEELIPGEETLDEAEAPVESDGLGPVLGAPLVDTQSATHIAYVGAAFTLTSSFRRAWARLRQTMIQQSRLTAACYLSQRWTEEKPVACWEIL